MNPRQGFTPGSGPFRDRLEFHVRKKDGPVSGGVPMYASAQAFDFLATTKNSSFLNRKLRCVPPEFPEGHYLN